MRFYKHDQKPSVLNWRCVFDAIYKTWFVCTIESVISMWWNRIELKIGEQNMMIAAYADKLIIMGETEDQVRNTAKNLTEE